MTRTHFEYMAAEIAHATEPKTVSREVMVDFAMSLAAKFNTNFDAGRFLARITQYDSGERNAVTYLNNH